MLSDGTERHTSPSRGAAGTPRPAAQPQASAPTEEAELARRFWGRLHLFALRRLRDRTAAEDVAQETLRRVVQALRDGRVENPQALPAFVFQTARNICLQHYRSAKREARALLQFKSSASQKVQGADPLLRVISDERRAAVRQALKQLEESDRELLRLIYYEGVETAEVARRFRITPGAVRVRKHRALQRLSKVLSPGVD